MQHGDWYFHIFQDDHHKGYDSSFLLDSWIVLSPYSLENTTFWIAGAAWPPASPTSSRLPRSTPMFPCCFWQGSHPGTLLSSLLSGTVKFKPDSPTLLETLQWLPAKTRIKDEVFAMTVRSYLIASHHSLPKSSVGLWPLFSCPSWLHLFFLLSLHSR